MTEPGKPNWGNRIILIIFGVLALVTIGGAVFATMSEWNAGNSPAARVQEEPLPSAGY